MSKNVLKISVAGKSFVGKSSLCNVIADRKIDIEYIPTIGVDCIIYYNIGTTSLTFCDFGGVDRFTSIISSYIRTSQVLLLCYSANDYDSYIDVMNKYRMYKNLKCTLNNRIILVVTKIDAKDILLDYDKWPENFIKDTGCPFVKTSSYNKIGIEELISECIGNESDDESDYISEISDKKISCCYI